MKIPMIALLAALTAHAHADNDVLNNYAKVAIASVRPNTQSGDLTGPPGTTPPGVTSDADNTTALGLIYGRRLNQDWSIELAAGVPPTVKVYGGGSASGMGEVGAGINYTWFRNAKISDAYNSAVHATSTTGELTGGAGLVFKIGAEIPLGGNWFADVVVHHYGIKTDITLTSATPGVGNIARTQHLDINPTVFALAIARRF